MLKMSREEARAIMDLLLDKGIAKADELAVALDNAQGNLPDGASVTVDVGDDSDDE